MVAWHCDVVESVDGALQYKEETQELRTWMPGHVSERSWLIFVWIPKKQAKAMSAVMNSEQKRET